MPKKRLSTSIKSENLDRISQIKKEYGLNSIASVINFCIAKVFGDIKKGDKKDE